MNHFRQAEHQSIGCGAGTANPSVPPGDIRLAWDDDKLASWLLQQHESGNSIVLLYARHICKFAIAGTSGADLIPADPGKRSLASLKKCLTRDRLLMAEVNYDSLQQANAMSAVWVDLVDIATEHRFKDWKGYRTSIFSQGRGKPLSDRSERQVWYEAGARCMYRGCGKDIGSTSLTTKPGAAAYLAHIVASDQDGPRGAPSCSHALSDDPNNVMLMCDEHHRLIDRIDVDGHPRELLETMRADHVAKVRAVLDSLRYKHTRGIAFLADVGNIKTPFHQRDMRDAMLGRQLSPAPEIDQLVRRFQRDDRLAPDFWRWVLHEHENDFRELVRRLSATQALGDQVEVISVFPLHLVPILVLCGRIVGEARQVEVFQYTRGQSWQWQQSVTPQSTKFFFLDGADKIPGNGQPSAVILSLELTADLDPNAMPTALRDSVRTGNSIWVRIRAKQPNPGCIAHPDDLTQFTAVVREAIRFVQDVLHAPTVHLFGISPASTLFRFGQILQAGHHPTYVVYDRPDRDREFVPALCITGQHVCEATSNGGATVQVIPLR